MKMNMEVKVFKRCEIVLSSTKTYENPFLDTEIDAVFTHESGRKITLPGFWNGGNEWKVRFSPDEAGKWEYTVTCSDKDNISLSDSGTVICVSAEPETDLEKHGYVTTKKDSHFLCYADGTPFFYLGDTHWQMPDYERLHECNCPGCNCGNQFKHLADDRKKKGFTVYQTYFDSAESDGGGNKRVHHWWSEKYTLINPQAFNESMDIMMEYLASIGMTVAIGFGIHTSSICRFGSKPEPMLAFVRYCVARYACYPVVWITGQEITDRRFNTFEIYKQAGALVGKLDGYHRPNGAHMYPMSFSDDRAQELNNESWHQWFALQAGHGGYPSLQPRSFYEGYYDNPKVKPFIETECQYEDIFCGGYNGYDPSRIGAWQAVQAGSAGFTYGVTGVWAMGWNQTDDRGWLLYSPEPWYVGMNKPGSTEMTYLRKFYEYVGWGKLVPSFDHEYGAFEMRKYVAISHIDDDVFVFYFFGKCNETGKIFNLKKNVKYQARWYDPIHGKFIDLPDVISADGTMDIPKMPCERDWVLLLNSYDLGAYETEEYPENINPISPDMAKLGEEIKAENISVLCENPESPLANLTDNNPDTFWCAFAPRVSQTFVIDLGKPEDVGYLCINSNQKDMRFIEFRIYGSNDGKDYTLLAERVGRRVAVGGPYTSFYAPIKGNYRYIKLFINSSDYPDALQLTKLAVFKKGE